ncbi:MAG: bifunctional hydroxymethylpyrimidine kinase/phosphomethylpyrimidine kinase [Eubacteriales bacterium]|nr:bifunctional hydroxymethylpyrimidine kinase/phosphomethylpyrimidine kinase [Eubacteriales bacterium]MDD4323642.1 bifunctional hydroxymethylpyrimidine kinase/phosphomethylpyrimidine kinase [Eubacteriales bacterium]MDD4540840.1 bifunctional hydroxymethylpyrimidine kinase/phosphomethylpyrimidine kinase [Eubacteriales bacterium]
MDQEVIRALTIAGSDASGGAGMAADLTTFGEYGLYGQVALTTVVTMDKETWGHHVTSLATSLVEAQFETIAAGTKPITAVKTGMLGTCDIVEQVARFLRENDFKYIVIDPVLACKGTDEVLNPETADSIRELLLPIATVATPNLLEAGVMSGLGTPTSLNEMKEAAKAIHALGTKYVVVKGGKAVEAETAIDILYDGEDFTVFSNLMIEPAHTHGAGCTFSAAITAGLALDLDIHQAVKKAKDYVTAAIEKGFQYNDFVGPLFRPAYRLDKQGRF